MHTRRPITPEVASSSLVVPAKIWKRVYKIFVNPFFITSFGGWEATHIKDKNEPCILNVAVSNGVDVVKTSVRVRCLLPVFDEMPVFIMSRPWILSLQKNHSVTFAARACGRSTGRIYQNACASLLPPKKNYTYFYLDFSFQPKSCKRRVCRRCKAARAQTYYDTSSPCQHRRFGKIGAP